MSNEEISNGSSKLEEKTDEENDKFESDKIPLVPSLRKLGRLSSDYNFDLLLKQYVHWTDERPMFSRCVVSAITASIGVLLARTTTRSQNTSSSRSGQRQRIDTIGILEVIAFAVHGGLV